MSIRTTEKKGKKEKEKLQKKGIYIREEEKKRGLKM